MSNRPRRKFCREMKEKLAKAGILKKRETRPLYMLHLNDDEAKKQFLYGVIVTLVLVLLLIALPISF